MFVFESFQCRQDINVSILADDGLDENYWIKWNSLHQSMIEENDSKIYDDISEKSNTICVFCGVKQIEISVGIE